MSRAAIAWSVQISTPLLLLVAACASAAAPLARSNADAPIEVAVTCVELDLVALRQLGVSFDTSKEAMQKLAAERPAELEALIDGFARAGCARSRFSPQVITQAGREAHVQAGHSTLTAIPELLPDGQIKVAVRCQIRRQIPAKYVSLPPSWVQFGIDLSVVARDGQIVCPAHPGNYHVNGEAPEAELVPFVFVTARRHSHGPNAPSQNIQPVRYSAPPQGGAPRTAPAPVPPPAR